jgi:hypothetical protein
LPVDCIAPGLDDVQFAAEFGCPFARRLFIRDDGN